MKTKINYRSLLPLVLASSIFLCFIDIVQLEVSGVFFVHFLLCYYTASLSYLKILPIGFIIFLLGLQSFIHLGIFGLNFVYIIPMTFLFLYLQKYITNHFIVYTVFTTLCLTIQMLLLEPKMLPITHGYNYTILRICANLFIVLIFNIFLVSR